MAPASEPRDEEIRAAVRQRYDLALPVAAEAAPSRRPLRRFALDPRGFDGLDHVRRYRLGERAYGDEFRPAGSPSPARIVVRITQGLSQAQAIDDLVGALMLHMAVRLPDAAERGLEVGDIAYCDFGNPPDSVMFVRGPVTAQVDRRGTPDVSVTDVAKQVDTQIRAYLQRVS